MDGLGAGHEAGPEGRGVSVEQRVVLRAEQPGRGIAAEHHRHHRRRLRRAHRERLLLGVPLVRKQRPQVVRERAARAARHAGGRGGTTLLWARLPCLQRRRESGRSQPRTGRSAPDTASCEQTSKQTSSHGRMASGALKQTRIAVSVRRCKKRP